MKKIHGKPSHGVARLGSARFGGAGLGSAWQGAAGCGGTWRDVAWLFFSEEHMNKIGKATKVTPVTDNQTNAGAEDIGVQTPYTAIVGIRGSADLLFHRWNADAVDEKAAAAKNSAAKKTDNVESYVWRDDEDRICVPGEYLRGSIIMASKYRQDPRSPRKSAMDLFRAGVVAMTPLAPLGVDKWDYEDRRRVVIQRNGINRVRPAMRSGWECEHELLVLTPEYIGRDLLHEIVSMAGRLIGIGDFRPTFGRFQVTSFRVRDAI
jgi:hypothetical protein